MRRLCNMLVLYWSCVPVLVARVTTMPVPQRRRVTVVQPRRTKPSLIPRSAGSENLLRRRTLLLRPPGSMSRTLRLKWKRRKMTPGWHPRRAPAVTWRRRDAGRRTARRCSGHWKTSGHKPLSMPRIHWLKMPHQKHYLHNLLYMFHANGAAPERTHWLHNPWRNPANHRPCLTPTTSYRCDATSSTSPYSNRNPCKHT